MEKDFEEYILDWWNEFVMNHESEAPKLMEAFIDEQESIQDYLEDGETPCDWLMAQDNADEIYSHFFGFSAKNQCCDDLPDTSTFLKGMYQQAYTGSYDFVEELIEDMADHSDGYDYPSWFFDDLAKGGCASGMVGMFIYNSDCKKFYIDHIDDMEEFVEDLEEELGEPIRNNKSIPHYTFVCWLCYEELAYSIVRTLFPGKF